MHSWTAALFYSGAWQTQPAADILNSAKLQTSRGYAVDGEMKPAMIRWRFNSSAVGNPYDPDDPRSPLYGLAGRNIPVSLSVDGVTDAVCEASSWSPGRTIDYVESASNPRGIRYVDLTANGILRRVGQWSRQLISPMRQWISGYANLRGYWPLEDGTAATQLTNAWPSGLPGYVRAGVTFQGTAGPSGSDKVITTQAGNVFGGQFGAGSTTAGWQLFLSFNATSSTLSATRSPFLRWRTSNGYSWTFGATNGAYTIDVVDSDGTSLLSNAVLYGTGAQPQQWVTMRFKVTASGSTVTVEAAWYNQGGAFTYGTTWTFTGTVGRLTAWYQGDTAGLALGHIGGLTTGTDDLTSYSFQRAFDGYAGETTDARFARLCSQEGIPYAVLGSSSTQMGPQAVDTLYNHFKEIMSTEDGMIYDARTVLRLTFRTRAFTYATAPQLALSYPSDLGWPFEKVLDDQQLANTVTVSQRNGGDATSIVATGPTAANPNGVYPGVGELKKTIDVNVYSEAAQLQPLADWYLSKLSLPGARYPTVVIDCDANPVKGAAAAALDPGDKITISGYAPDTITLKVICVETETERGRRTVTLTCVPGDVWAPATYDSTARYDSASTTLGAGVTAAATSWSFSTTNAGDVWDTTATPYDVLCGGERVTVTAMGAVTGTGPYVQTATVTRAVNGISKAQTAGSEIHIATPGRYAL
jgi:hypothetical protein